MREWIVPDDDIGVDGAYFGYQELLRCRDCKYHYYDTYSGIPYCANIVGESWKDEDYCSKAERKEK